MLNHILNKGVIIVHVEEKIPENLENPLVYGIFRSQAEKMKNFENVFFELKNPYIYILVKSYPFIF